MNNDYTEIKDADEEHSKSGKCQRIPKHYITLLQDSPGALVMLIIGAIYFNDCPAISSLSLYVVLFGVTILCTALIKFHWQIPRLPPKNHPKSIGLHLSNFLGIATIGLAIWGAVITWEEAREIYSGAKKGCNQVIFTTAFVSSIICIAIIGIMLFTAIAITIVKTRHQGNESLSEVVVVENSYRAVGNEDGDERLVEGVEPPTS